MLRRLLTLLAAVTTAGAVTLTAVPAKADPTGPELIVNGTFDGGAQPWYGATVGDGRLCADVPGGTANPWDVVIGHNDLSLARDETYELRLWASGTPDGNTPRVVVGLGVAPYDGYFAATPRVGPDGSAFVYTFTAPVDTSQAQVAFQIGGSAEPWRFCVDDVSLRGGAEPPVYQPDTGPRVRVNQVGYLPGGPKFATVVTEAPEALPWRLVDASGATVTAGHSVPRGLDRSSGQRVHTVDFGAYRAPGVGLTLVADGETSRPFDIAADLYAGLRADALRFYYPQRSGIEIRDELRPGYGRPAGHLGVAPNRGDTEVPCQPGVCDYTLDVRGGWYDAGDQGKYVINGGISVHQLMSQVERAATAPTADPAALGDGALAIPESGNGVPDILDEARWELEFLISMQVPAGEPLAGLAHHKIHDAQWTGQPTLPHLDPQRRELHPPSTAAALNLAATGAQAARVFAPYDPAFAGRALAAARTAWAAAVRHPAVYASPTDGEGGGAYDDADVTDEFYWAAAELYLTTGERRYADSLRASPHHTGDVWRERGFDWANTAQLGRLQLATVPNRLPDRGRVRRSVLAGADRYLATMRDHPYGMPYAPSENTYDWGSNNLVLNNMVVLATAFDLTGAVRYRDGVIAGMDYLLGRNALNQSYVTGYGEVHSHRQHSRWYANPVDPTLPRPPRGTLAGGPNSSIQDPLARSLLHGCPPQFCYLDDFMSWSTNELTINWNAPLAWISAFLDDQGDAARRPPRRIG